MEDGICQFCSADQIDLAGVKLHLIKGECEVFNELPALDLSAD